MNSQAEEAPPDGIEGAASRLQAVAAGRAGMPEELVALFVAAMRGPWPAGPFCQASSLLELLHLEQCLAAIACRRST